MKGKREKRLAVHDGRCAGDGEKTVYHAPSTVYRNWLSPEARLSVWLLAGLLARFGVERLPISKKWRQWHIRTTL